METNLNIHGDEVSQRDGTKEQTQSCRKCEKDRPLSYYISQRVPAGSPTKTCLRCRNGNILPERKRLQAAKVANTRLNQASLELAAEVITR
jgi:hypothetical protein